MARRRQTPRRQSKAKATVSGILGTLQALRVLTRLPLWAKITLGVGALGALGYKAGLASKLGIGGHTGTGIQKEYTY